RYPTLLLEAIVDHARRALDGAEVFRVLGNVLTGWVEQREHRNPPVHLGMLLEVGLKGAKAAHDVLRRVRAVDPEDEELRPSHLELGLEPAHLVALGQLLELERIDGDRPRGDECTPLSIRAEARVEVAVRVEEVATRA